MAKASKLKKPTGQKNFKPREVVERWNRENPTAITAVGYSAGKDSIAMLQLLIAHLERVHPYFLYQVAGLEFEERRLRAAERRYGVEIARFSSPFLHMRMKDGNFRYASKKLANLRPVSVKVLYAFIRSKLGATWVALGERWPDSLQRNAMIRKEGVEGVDSSRKVWWPIGYWADKYLFNFIRTKRLPLPDEYRGMVETSRNGGRQTRNLEGFFWYDTALYVREKYPEDFKKILRAFPKLVAQIARYDATGVEPGTEEMADDLSSASEE